MDLTMRLSFPDHTVLFLLPLFFLIASGCDQASREVPQNNPASSEGKTEKTAEKNTSGWWIGDPLRHDELDFVFFPVHQPREDRGRSRSYASWKESKEPSVRYGAMGGTVRQGHFLNMILWDPLKDRHHLLRDSVLHMTRITYHPLSDTASNGFLLYRVIARDRNEDGKYLKSDGTALFHSLPDGSAWRRLTPKGHRVLRVFLPQEEGMILIRTEQGEGEEESVHHLRTSLKDPRMATPFFDSSFEKELKRALGAP